MGIWHAIGLAVAVAVAIELAVARVDCLESCRYLLEVGVPMATHVFDSTANPCLGQRRT